MPAPDRGQEGNYVLVVVIVRPCGLSLSYSLVVSYEVVNQLDDERRRTNLFLLIQGSSTYFVGM